jgi:PAS domain S-box-containing protein
MPVGVFLVLTAILVGRDSSRGFEAPLLLAFLNTLFLIGILLAVAWMAARSYRATGSLTFLMMGCGALFRGVSQLIANSVMAGFGNPNFKITLYDPCCLLAGVCHLMSAYYLLADLPGTHPAETRSRHVAIPYAGIVVLVCVAATLALEHKLPVFFAPGGGPSLLRQFVVGGALCMFASSGLIFVGIYYTMKTEFGYWYGLALLLAAVGFISVFFLRTLWDPLRWLGRGAQYLSGVYFIFALLAGRREMDRESVGATATTGWGLWPYLEQKVKERTLALEKANEDLQKEMAKRKLTEQALQESEEQYRRVFEVKSDAVFLMDRETERLIDANPVAVKLYGYSRQELLLLKAGDISAEPEKTSRAIAEGQTFVPLRWHRKKDGAVFPVEIARSFFWYHGREVIVAAIRDITERKRAEEILRLANLCNRSLIEASLDPLVTIGPDGRITDVNAAAEAATGRSRGELMGTDFCDYFTDPEKARAGYQQVFREGLVKDHALELRHRDGHVISVLYNASVYRDEQGQAIGVFAAARDITERKRAEERISYLAAIVESTDDAVIGKTLDGTVQSWNRGAERVYGYTAGEIIGRPISVLLPADGREELEKIMARLKAGDAMEHFETTRLHKDGHLIPVALTISPIKDTGGRIVGASTIARDITERKRAEGELRTSEERYRMAQEMGHVGNWEYNFQTKQFWGSNEAKRIYGFDAEQTSFSTDEVENCIPERVRVHQALADLIEAGKPYDLEFEILPRNSSEPRIISSIAQLQRDERGVPLKVVGVIQDITERKRAEEAVSKAHALQRAIFDSTGDFIWSVDSQDFGMLTFNRAFYDYHVQQRGIRLRVGQRPEELLPDADYIERWRGYYQRALASGPFTTEYLTVSGKVMLLLTFNLLNHDEAIFGISVFGKDITERKREEEDLRVSHERLRALAARVQAIREEESTRLAREIHDVLAQELTSLKVDVTVLTRLLDQSPAEFDRILACEKLRGMTVTTDTAIQAVQKIATELRPVVLDSLGLCAAIEWQVKEFQAHTGIRCQARLPSKDPPLDRDGSTALFRILQESLTNVARHAAATAVEVLLQCQAGYVILAIQDNGRGIQESQADAPGALGLLGLRERALLLGGRCDISGRPGEGTRVEARLPLPPKVNSEEKQS